MKIKDYVFAAGIVLAIVVGVNFPVGGQTVTERVVEKLGAAGQDFPGPCITIGGHSICGDKRGMSVATTSICSIKAPASTSTLTFASVNFSVSSTTASTVTIAKGTNSNATTTALVPQVSISANAQSATTVFGSTTAAFTFAPGTYFNVGIQGGTGTFSPTGFCTAEFRVL